MQTKLQKGILKAAWLPCLALIVCAGSAHASANIISNGDFEAGNTGFTSNYAYFAPGTGLFPPATYTVDTNPNNDHPAWASYGDHTTGSGNMLVVNGWSPSSGQDVGTGPDFWTQTVNVQAGQSYSFSFWGASSYGQNPGQVQLLVDGVATGPTFSLDNVASWTNYTTAFNSGANSFLTLSLVETGGQYSGNDFAIDDISAAPVPEASSIVTMALFLGLGAVFMIRRKRDQSA